MRRLWEKNVDSCEGGEEKGNVDKARGDYGKRMWTGVRVGKRKGMWIRCEALKGKERRIAVINNSDFPNNSI